MIYATKIRLNTGCSRPTNCCDISTIFLTGDVKEGYYPKKEVYDMVEVFGKTVRVYLGEQPTLHGAISLNGEKYVRSMPNDTVNDNLLMLQRG